MGNADADPNAPHPFSASLLKSATKFYSAALVSATPIDLCPAAYISSQAEIRCRLPVRDFTQNSRIAIRLQASLGYVRKHLSPHLLQTCRQVYNEAAYHWWGCNIWRFTDDVGWVVLWRFLLSIGTNALSHIQKLEVLAPLAVNQEHLLTVAEAWHIKNEPKLHMAKTWRGGVNRTCVDLVHDFWKRERTLQKLTLLVPDDYALFPFKHNKAWCDDPLYMGFLPKVRIVVEDGGALFDMQFVLDQGWDVVAMPGSGISNPRTLGMRSGLTTTKAEQVWESDTDLHLAGLSQLFEEQETSTISKGKRASRELKGKKLERLLSGFGPCMILAEDISCQCWWCKFDYVFDRSLHKPIGVLYTSLVEVQERQIQDWMEEFECYLGPDIV
ncbi:hypothetical protein G7Y79_00014g036960 [Physcia stellaris]|nr:hypothetical protein G7Y79_00014g036960 [Physcia stellaris]